MKRQILVLMILSILLVVPLVNALDDYAPVKQGEQITITQVCQGATYVNITSISYPNSSQALGSVVMSNLGSGGFEYNFTNTSALGRYDVRMISDGCENTFAVYFYVTPSGSVFTSALSIPIFLPMVMMLLVSFVFFFIMTRTKKNEYKLTFMVFGIIFIIFAVGFGISASTELLYGFPLLNAWVGGFYKLFVITLTWGSIIAVIVGSFYVIRKVFSSRGYIIR